MIKKFVFSIVMMLMSTASWAQLSEDSTVTIIDGLKVPFVEKSYVANYSFQDNWHVGVYAGVTSNWGSDCSHAGFFQIMGPAFAVAVGKQITPVSDLRMQINYVRNTGVTDNKFTLSDFFNTNGFNASDYDHGRFKWNSFGLNIDYMPNFTNMILGFRENRIFHFSGLIGLGGCVSSGYNTDKFADALGIDNSHGSQLENKDKYDSRRRSLVNIRLGLAMTALVRNNINVHLEAVENFLDNSYDSNPTTNNIWDGHLDVMLGVTYHFKGKGGRPAGFYYPRHDIDFYKKKLDIANDLRDKANKRKKEVEEQIPDTIAMDAHVMYTLIAFDEESAVIDRLQQTNIYTTANAWLNEPSSDIYITNSTSEDNKLFRNRANAIRDILLERYEIPASKIHVEAEEKKIRPRANYIVFIVND